jgi:transposase InsO family protein
MRGLGLRACQPAPWRPVTTEADGRHRIPDLLSRDFTAAGPGTKFVGDSTYIPTWEGFPYLATVIDRRPFRALPSALGELPATRRPHGGEPAGRVTP